MDLPANVNFTEPSDGWTLDQSEDEIESVQAFFIGGKVVVELWGKCTLASPAGDRVERKEFQQNSSTTVPEGQWKVVRIVSGVYDDNNAAVEFELSGNAKGIVAHRRF